jgi:hypothetical protein
VQNLFGRCLAVALVGGGFTATGDVAWLMRRGARVLSATDVPAPTADEGAPIPVDEGTTGLAEAVVIQRQPSPGPERVELADLRRGDRLQVWLAHETAPLVLDVVEPGSGAALLHRGGGERVRIEGPIRRGGSLCLVPLGLARAAVPPAPESLGPVTAVAVGR